ncbi:MAG TPA: VOC family protein [Thermoplasmata archaeon]|nr:VOC family protein [Thermoplasmata archaeon]
MQAKFFYTGIRVRDLDESIQFYTKVLGMSLTGRTRIAATGGEAADLQSEPNGPRLELNFYPAGSPHAPPFAPGEGLDHLAFQVPDLNAALEEAKRAGHPPVLEVAGPNSRWVYITDPNGLYIELFA